MTRAKLAQRDRWAEKKGFKHEQRRIAAEYAKRGELPATQPQRKQPRPNAPTLQPLPLLELEARHTLDEQPALAPVVPPDPPSVPSTVLDVGDGWRVAQDGCGWRASHATQGQTGLYMGYEGAQHAIERGHYGSI